LKADPKGVLTGEHYLDGDHACAEGVLAAGCRFVAGYPITPSTEVAERYCARIPLVGGIFIQMEDELGAMAAVVGGSWAGKKSMTVTSGPGFSLMMENIGLVIFLDITSISSAFGMTTFSVMCPTHSSSITNVGTRYFSVRLNALIV